MANYIYGILFGLGGALLCLFGYGFFSRYFPPLRECSKEPSTGTSTETTLPEGLENRLAAVESEMDEYKRAHRNLEMEWADTAQKMRSIIGRLDKQNSRQKAREAAEEPAELSDQEIAAKFFVKRMGGIG